MEDAVTRQHAQYLVAAGLALGARAVGRLMEHQRTKVPFVDLHALGVEPSPATAQALQRAARTAVRHALGDEPRAVLMTPVDGGYRVRVMLPVQRPPLEPHELTDLQVAWERAQPRELGRTRVPPDPSREVTLRQAELDATLQDLRAVQTRAAHGEPAWQADLADTMNRARMATDALRGAMQRAHALSLGRPVQADTLHFRVRAEGLEGLSLAERDRALRDVFARAAGLRDPGELRVTTRPTRNPGESLAYVAFNFRHGATRGPEHLNPASLQNAILAGATTVPSATLKAATAAAHVTVRAVEAFTQPVRPAADPSPLDLPPPPTLRRDAPARSLSS